MSSKPKLSPSKLLKVKSLDLLHSAEQGKFFPIKTNDISKYIPLLRSSVPAEYYGQLIKEITSVPAGADVFLTGRKKRSLKELASDVPFYVNFEAELSWAKNIISRNITELSLFVKMSEVYSRYLIVGQYKAALLKLDEIQEKFGYSNWLVRNKIAFLQLTEGLEAQKRYIKEIKDGLTKDSLSKFLVHWTSVRNEEQTSVSRFTSQIASIVADLNPNRQHGFDIYIKYHLLGIEPLDPEEFIHVVRLSYSTSIIDYYEDFVALLRILIVNDNTKYRAKAYHYLSKENTVIDQRIEILKHVTGINLPKDNVAAKVLTAFDLMMRGENFNSEKIVEEQLELTPTNPIFLITQAYLQTFKEGDQSNNTSLAHDSGQFESVDLKTLIVAKLSKIISEGTVSASKEFNELNKLALNFAGFSWVSSISYVFAQEHFLSGIDDKTMPLIPLKAAIPHPVFLVCYQSSMIYDLYENLCSQSFAGSLTLHYYLALVGKLDSQKLHLLDPLYRNLIEGLNNYKTGEYSESIDACKLLLNCSLGYFKRRGFGLITRCYLNINDLKSACETIGKCYVYNHEYYPFLPLREFGAIVKPGTKKWRIVNALIDLSINCDAYVKHVGHEMENARRFAYEDFLLKLGINKPSDLRPFLEKLDRIKLIYYLNIICVESNMDTSDAFAGGSQLVVEERLAICRMLTEIDPTNNFSYQGEIKELVRKLVINSRRQEVDQSRIYVDVQSVKDKAEIELKENFERYKAYIKYDLKSVNEKKGQKSRETKDSSSLGSVINTPENEVYELLSFLFNEVTSLYLSASIGLDRFISTRIRHGELERNMRSTIQKYNLITKRTTKNGPYLRNDFWLNRLAASNETLKNVNNAFVKFSESYDNLIGKIANDWLQIKKSDKPGGLFDFEIVDIDINLIANSVKEETSLKEFTDILIQHLDNKLIISLLNIRDKLHNDAKSQAKMLLNKLFDDLNRIIPTQITDIQGAISQARTDFGAQFDKIIEWFVPSFSGNSAPYSIEDAVMVAEAIIKEAHPFFTVRVESDEESTFLIHGRLPIFMDIFINIFENAVKRSGLEQPKATVKIWASHVDDNITVINCKVSNSLGINVDEAAIVADLKRKKKLLEAEAYHDYLASEGNSGLFKIYKSVRDFNVKDSEIEPTVDFGIESNLFEITLSVPFKIYTLQPDEESS